MSKELPFLVLCIEEYKSYKNMSGKEVLDLFNKYDVCDYIIEFYESLHITGMKCIINDIEDYISSHKNKK